MCIASHRMKWAPPQHLCHPFMIRLSSCETWSGVGLVQYVLQYFTKLHLCQIHPKVIYIIFTDHLSLSLPPSLSLSLALSLSFFLSIYLQSLHLIYIKRSRNLFERIFYLFERIFYLFERILFVRTIYLFDRTNLLFVRTIN